MKPPGKKIEYTTMWFDGERKAESKGYNRAIDDMNKWIDEAPIEDMEWSGVPITPLEAEKLRQLLKGGTNDKNPNT